MTTEPHEVLDLHVLLARSGGQHLLGSLVSADLNVNLLAFTGAEGIEEHVNREVDVLLVALEGEGVLAIDGVETVLAPGQATIVPRGASRAIRSAGDRFVYLTCHGRRRGLMPQVGRAWEAGRGLEDRGVGSGCSGVTQPT